MAVRILRNPSDGALACTRVQSDLSVNWQSGRAANQRCDVIQVETSALIQRPLQAVFAFVADTQNSPRWQIAITCHALETAIITLETDRKVGIKSTSGPFEFDTLYHFETAKDSTQITWTCRLHVSEPYRFVEALIGQVVAMETEVSFTILKKLLEEESKCGYYRHISDLPH